MFLVIPRLAHPPRLKIRKKNLLTVLSNGVNYPQCDDTDDETQGEKTSKPQPRILFLKQLHHSELFTLSENRA